MVSVMLEMTLGMIIALVINEKFRLRGVMRGIILLPWAIPSIIGARIWQLIYQYENGIANYIVRSFFGTEVNWLGNTSAAFTSVG